MVRDSYLRKHLQSDKLKPEETQNKEKVQYYCILASTNLLKTLKNGIFEVNQFDNFLDDGDENLDNLELERKHRKERVKRFAEGVTIFKNSYKKGMKYFLEERFITSE